MPGVVRVSGAVEGAACSGGAGAVGRVHRVVKPVLGACGLAEWS